MRLPVAGPPAAHSGVPSWNGAVYAGASVTMRGIYDYDSVGMDVSVLSADGVLSDPATTIVLPPGARSLRGARVPPRATSPGFSRRD
jgi:hypothetical protein